MQFGLHTFGDITGGNDNRQMSHAQVIRNVIVEGVLADTVGVDFFGVGEHHQADYAVSAPEIVLASIAARTSRIRVGSAVTVLSADDPVRVFQRFSTLQAAAGGRVEIILGRGSFTEAFALFGHDIAQYELLFDEKLDLFARLLRHKAVSWRGTVRSPLDRQSVFPPLETIGLQAWVAVGASPPSVLRAANYGLAMMLAIVGGPAHRFEPFVELYIKAFEKLGRPIQPIGVHSLGYVAEDDALARDEYWPAYKRARDQLGLQRGWRPIERATFDREVDQGALYVGGPETVARKIAATVKTLGLTRFDMKYSAGLLGHDQLCRSVELYGRKVIPLARDMLR